jgi:hypothetical protein
MRRTNQSGPNKLPVFVAGSLPATRPFAQNTEFGRTLRPYDSIDQRARCQYRHASRKEPNQRPATAFRSRSNAITAALKSP